MQKQRRRSISFAVTEADQRLCFRYLDSTINPKFQASSHLQWLYSLVCVRPSQIPHCWFFHVAAHIANWCNLGLVSNKVMISESPMLHTKFSGNLSTGSGEEDFWRFLIIYGRGGHLGHVTSIMFIDFISLYLKAYIQNLVENDPFVSKKNKF